MCQHFASVYLDFEKIYNTTWRFGQRKVRGSIRLFSYPFSSMIVISLFVLAMLHLIHTNKKTEFPKGQNWVWYYSHLPPTNTKRGFSFSAVETQCVNLIARVMYTLAPILKVTVSCLSHLSYFWSLFSTTPTAARN